jgi:hypothetical protein
VTVAGGERAFCDARLPGVEVLPLVAIVGVGESTVTPDASLPRRPCSRWPHRDGTGAEQADTLPQLTWDSRPQTECPTPERPHSPTVGGVCHYRD